MNARQLWRQTLTVIRDNPALYLPVAWATVLGCLWEQLRLIFLRVLPTYLLQTHSVMGGSGGFAERGSTQYLAAQVILGLLTNICRLAHLICFYVALLMTAKMVRRYLTGVDKGALVNWRVVGLSFAMYICFPLALVPFFWSSVRFLHEGSLQQYCQQIEICLVFILIAWLFASPSLRLVAHEFGRIVSQDAVRIVRIYAVLSAFALALLDLAAMHIHVTGRSTYVQGTFTTLFIELITSIPLVPLFVAMSLLAYEGDRVTGTELVAS